MRVTVKTSLLDRCIYPIYNYPARVILVVTFARLNAKDIIVTGILL